ncbi:hypothetical protein I313_03532 [Cryptococcus deuterogattii Ram5]|uniref:Unplaced genomic scaffold supercont1.8, whole genome shotgun sequence n=1 Tax=Cryptococcus deuterogattii Ram5 TaxID=1296110 RepID=A0A0D0T391_9TREE|nr:hypothetical protein I313_03532 [Cryptococcus deuterogattii Ram5]
MVEEEIDMNKGRRGMQGISQYQ